MTRPRFLLVFMAIAACTGGGAGQVVDRSTYVIDSIHPLLRPVTRRERFYVDPESGEAELTAIVRIRLDGADRFILVQEPERGGSPIVVADSAGRIPVFPSAETARQYIARVFTADTGNPGKRALHSQMQQVLSTMDPVRADLDAALRWSRSASSDGIDAAQAAMVWDLLAGAAVAPLLAQFDPMGFYALTENAGKGGLDSSAYRIAKTGMMLSGIVAEARIRGGGPDARIPFPGDTAVWSPADRETLAEIFTRGIAALRGRLSLDAAQTNVRETWPAPSPARLEIRLMSGERNEITRKRPDDRLLPGNLERSVHEHVGPPLPRGSTSAAAYARYLRDREQYIRDLVAHRRQEYLYQEANQRAVPLHVMVINSGDQPAEDLTVVWKLPPGMRFVAEEMREFVHRSPDEPRSPREYEDPSVRRAAYVPNERVQRAGSDFARRDAVRAADGSWLLEQRIRHGIAPRDAYPFQNVTAQFPNFESVGPFDLHVEVRSASGDTTEYRLRVNVRLLQN